jgi:phage gp29-like protein
MANNAQLLDEIATRETAQGFSPGNWLTGLPDPDPVLRKKGEYASVLSELTADDQVITAMQQRKLKTLLKGDYKFVPGKAEGQESSSEAKQLCDRLIKDLERVDLYNLISEVLEAPYYGFTPCEVLWRPEGSRLHIYDVVAKPRDWFQFNEKNQFSFIGSSLALPEQVPDYKFVLARHFPTYENPYGLRLLSRCLWPVAFKKGGVRWWLRFAEKFGLPWVLGEANERMDENERQAAALQLQSMVEDAVAVVSGLKAHVHEPSGKGEVHQSLVGHWDAAIAKVLCGQTLTSDVGQGGTGSYAQAKTHYEVLDDFAQADAILVRTFFNDLAWSYAQVNAPDVLSPVFEYDEPEDQAAKADLDGKKYKVGVRFTKKYFVQNYGMADDEFYMQGENGSASGGQGSDFAASDNEPEAQDALDSMVDSMLDDAQQAAQSQADSLMQLIEQAESYEEAKLLLAEALGEGAEDQMAEQLLNGMLNSALLGRWEVRDQRSEARGQGPEDGGQDA